MVQIEGQQPEVALALPVIECHGAGRRARRAGFVSSAGRYSRGDAFYPSGPRRETHFPQVRRIAGSSSEDNCVAVLVRPACRRGKSGELLSGADKGIICACLDLRASVEGCHPPIETGGIVQPGGCVSNEQEVLAIGGP